MCQELFLTQRLVVSEHEEAFGRVSPSTLVHHVHLVKTKEVAQSEALMHRDFVFDCGGCLAQIRYDASGVK